MLFSCSKKRNNEKNITKKNKKIEWLDFNKAYEKAKKEKKFLLVDFYSNGCGYCKKMDETTYKDNSVLKILNKDFVTAKIVTEDIDYRVKYKGVKYYDLQEFLYAIRINSLPTTGFIDKKGEFITVIPGYIPPKMMKNILEYINQLCFTKKIPFKQFLEGSKKCENTK